MIRNRSAALAASTFLALMASSSLAPAQAAKKPDAAALAEAKSHFEKGVKLHKGGALPEALAEYELANRLSPRVSILRNIAQVRWDLKQFAAAYTAYEELLNLYGSTLLAPDVKKFKAALTELAGLTGVLDLRVVVADRVSGTAPAPDAKIRVDDKEVGVSPLPSPLRLNLGPHKLSITKEGFDPVNQSFEVRAGETTPLTQELKPEVSTGHVVVSGAGAEGGARVRVDDKDVGALPWEGDLPPGAHRIEAGGEELKAEPRTIEVARGARVEVAFQLSPRMGHLLVDPHAVDADVRVDGKAVGHGAWEGDIKVGSHEITVRLLGFTTYRQTIVLHEGERLPVAINLAVDKEAHADDYRGLYATFEGSFQVAPSPSNYLSANCSNAGITCTKAASLGPALLLSIGYAIDWVGFEATFYGRYDHTPETVTAAAPEVLTTSMSEFAIGGGLGVRFLSKTQVVRATVGFRVLVLPEVFFESANYTAPQTGLPEITPAIGQRPSSVFGVAPMLAWDAAILIGSSKTKFRLGALASLEHHPSTEAQVTPSDGSLPTTISPYGSTGWEFFVGPTIGFMSGY